MKKRIIGIISDQSNTILMCLPMKILDAFKAVSKSSEEVVKKNNKEVEILLFNYKKLLISYS